MIPKFFCAECVFDFVGRPFHSEGSSVLCNGLNNCDWPNAGVGCKRPAIGSISTANL